MEARPEIAAKTIRAAGTLARQRTGLGLASALGLQAQRPCVLPLALGASIPCKEALVVVHPAAPQLVTVRLATASGLVAGEACGVAAATGLLATGTAGPDAGRDAGGSYRPA